MNARSAQTLTAALAALLVILVGATIFIILSRPSVGPSPTPSRTLPSFVLPSPTATTVAVASPSASVAPSASAVVVTPTPFTPTPSAVPSSGASPTPLQPSPSPTPLPTPTLTPSPSPAPSPTPSPTATPSPTPTIVPSAPQRTLQLTGVGLDAAGITGNVPRTVTFNTDGPSTIVASVGNSSGSVRVCLRQEPQLKGMCVTTRNGSVQQSTTDAGSDTWTASFIGKDGSPTADLTIQFNATQPSATLDSFRWTGTTSPAYNGFDAQTDALTDGQISVQASFDDGSNGAYDWHLVIKPQGGDPVFDQSGGPDQSVDQGQHVGNGPYRVTLSDPDSIANPDRAVILTATVSWP